jgi:nitrate/nitrite transporter NarK
MPLDAPLIKAVLLEAHKMWGAIYGLMLTAWGFAGVLGPTLIARIRQSSGHYTQALHVISTIVLVSSVIPLITRPPRAEAAEQERRLKAA